MRNQLKVLIVFFALVFTIFFSVQILNEVSKIMPENPVIQLLMGFYKSLVSLLINWGSPDVILWIFGILIGIAGGIYLKSRNHRE